MVGDWWLAKPQWSSCHSTGVLPTPSTFDARCSHEFHTKIMWFETQCKSQHSQRSRFWSKGHCKHKRGKDWDPQWGAMAWLTWSWLRGFRDIGVAQERVIDERVVGSKVCPWKLKYESGGARRSWRASRRIHCQLGFFGKVYWVTVPSLVLMEYVLSTPKKTPPKSSTAPFSQPSVQADPADESDEFDVIWLVIVMVNRTESPTPLDDLQSFSHQFHWLISTLNFTVPATMAG